MWYDTVRYSVCVYAIMVLCHIFSIFNHSIIFHFYSTSPIRKPLVNLPPDFSKCSVRIVEIRKTGTMDDIVSLPTVRLYLKNTEGKGRGVFSHESIPKRTLIHISPVLILADHDNDSTKNTILGHYTYNWGKDQAMALGLGSMFNHSKTNNVGFVRAKDKEIIEYYTLVDVPADTELCIHYGPRLWFDDADGEVDQETAKADEDDNTSADYLIGMDLW